MTRRFFLGSAILFISGLYKAAVSQQEKQLVAVVVPHKCVGCNDCLRICPSGSVNMNRNKAHINKKTCTGCKLCFSVCSYGAIELCEKK